MDLYELRRRYYRKALVLPHLQQVLIARHKVICAAGGRALQNPVVCGIFGDELDALLRLEVLCKA